MRNISMTMTLALALLHASGASAGAQEKQSAQANGRSERRVPVTVVLSDNLPPGTRFVMKRLPNAARRDVIVLASDATEAELGQAVRTLLAVRQKDGDIPVTNQTIRIRPSTSKAAARPPYPWIARVLSDVSRADRIEIPDVGRARAVQIWLPRQETKHQARLKTRE